MPKGLCWLGIAGGILVLCGGIVWCFASLINLMLDRYPNEFWELIIAVGSGMLLGYVVGLTDLPKHLRQIGLRLTQIPPVQRVWTLPTTKRLRWKMEELLYLGGGLLAILSLLALVIQGLSLWRRWDIGMRFSTEILIVGLFLLYFFWWYSSGKDVKLWLQRKIAERRP